MEVSWNELCPCLYKKCWGWRRKTGRGFDAVAFILPPICLKINSDDILSLIGQNGNLGQIRGYIELAVQSTAGFYLFNYRDFELNI